MASGNSGLGRRRRPYDDVFPSAFSMFVARTLRTWLPTPRKGGVSHATSTEGAPGMPLPSPTGGREAIWDRGACLPPAKR